jgi:predicted glycogen debranching enzyme
MTPAKDYPTVLDEPLVRFGREICGDLAAGLRREWLITNGLGGYASGTVAGPMTRSYHGLLVAALEPPVAGTVLVGGLLELATYSGRRYSLSAAEFAGGTVDPHGYVNLQEFRLEGTLPVWTYALGDALLERRLWMAHGANTTYLSYTVSRATSPIDLDLTPLVTHRTFHALSSGYGWTPEIDERSHGVTIRAFAGAAPFSLLADGGQFVAGGDWWRNFHYREETARGLADCGDLYAPGTFSASLPPGATLTLAFTTEMDLVLDGPGSLAAEQTRQHDLLRRAGAEQAPPAVQQLTLAADQFIVARQHVPVGESGTAGQPGQSGKRVIAGYHWFNDWGRDTMIALPGLTLATGRPEDAAGILRTFARHVSDGLLPNNFPDQDGVIPGYNTADATLWYVVAVRAYYRAIRDDALVDDLLPTLRAIINCHLAGTRYGIGVDAADGLLRAGEPGVQLTWMDAKVGDWVVTPRIGKPVEINALWYNALRTLASLPATRHEPAAAAYDALADRARASFRHRFVLPDGSGLADVVDGPDGDETALRPNQIFAVSLPDALLEGDEAAAVVLAVGKDLLTTYGLRSLSPADPAYRGDYGGDQLRRDSGYHQGPVWSWLLGAYAEAVGRVTGDRTAVLDLLRPVEHHLRDAGLGSISEILEGDPPHLPRGCIAQAWGVAEILRVWRQRLAGSEHVG